MMHRTNIKLFYIPIWMLEKANCFNLSLSDLLEPSLVVDKVSKTDVDKYIAEQHSVYYKFNLPVSPQVVMAPYHSIRDLDDLFGGPIEIHTLPLDWQYNMLDTNIDVFLTSAAHLYKKEDGGRPKFTVMPHLMYVNNNTIVMTIRRVDTVEDKNKYVEDSVDTLLSAGLTMPEIVNMPYGRYLLSLVTTKASRTA